ncbi:MAG: hypothetical protein ACRECV_00730 [Xanthobacteraceae bacterium]
MLRKLSCGVNTSPAASTMVEVRKMTSPDYLIEINAIAAIGE